MQSAPSVEAIAVEMVVVGVVVGDRRLIRVDDSAQGVVVGGDELVGSSLVVVVMVVVTSYLSFPW